MLQAAASWLITTLPLLDFDCHPSEVSRCGNEHRKFIPVNAYPTADGYVFIAIGNDRQWQRLTELPAFGSLQSDVRRTNAGRHSERAAIHRELAQATRGLASAALMRDLARRGIPHAPINTIREVREMPAIAEKLTKTRTPAGERIHLPPLAVDLEEGVRNYAFAPRYSEHTEALLQEAGLAPEEITVLRQDGIVP
jgi:crotonobetainyl-CoA:carnitine CoA-transferase CaiB-like acyl-CoA transferase